MSSKRAKQMRKYKVVKAEYLSLNPDCKASIAGCCVGLATTIHHRKGRSDNLLCDTKFFMGNCMPCHAYIEAHPAESYKKGWMISRLAI